MKTLHLPLEKKWFNMTNPDGKPEDYREINEYWFKRLVFDYKKVFKYCTGYNWDDNIFRIEGIKFITSSKQEMFGFVPFDSNKMTSGYPSKNDSARIKIYKHAGIEIRTGKPEWGAIPGKLYFVIKHGDQII